MWVFDEDCQKDSISSLYMPELESDAFWKLPLLRALHTRNLSMACETLHTNDSAQRSAIIFKIIGISAFQGLLLRATCKPPFLLQKVKKSKKPMAAAGLLERSGGCKLMQQGHCQAGLHSKLVYYGFGCMQAIPSPVNLYCHRISSAPPNAYNCQFTLMHCNMTPFFMTHAFD